MLCVYGHHKYVYTSCAGIDFRRQILMSNINPRAVKVVSHEPKFTQIATTALRTKNREFANFFHDKKVVKYAVNCSQVVLRASQDILTNMIKSIVKIRQIVA